MKDLTLPRRLLDTRGYFDDPDDAAAFDLTLLSWGRWESIRAERKASLEHKIEAGRQGLEDDEYKEQEARLAAIRRQAGVTR